MALKESNVRNAILAIIKIKILKFVNNAILFVKNVQHYCNVLAVLMAIFMMLSINNV